MTSPASLTPRNGTSVIPDDGGNLARVHPRGSFSFEQPQQFGAQITDAGWVYLLSPASAGAVSRGFPSSHPPRPFPSVLPKVDHITHRGAPIFVDETKFTRSALA